MSADSRKENVIMSEKRYQISPIELVRWAEPLFGFGEGKATGFSEKTVASYEAAAGIRLPAALREYYLACGKAGLNEMLHPILIPDETGKPFGGRLSFSHDYIEDAMLDIRRHNRPAARSRNGCGRYPKSAGRNSWTTICCSGGRTRAAGTQASGSGIWISRTRWCTSTTKTPCTTGGPLPILFSPSSWPPCLKI